MVTLGLDSGSATTKAAVFDGEKIQKIYLEKTSDRPGKVIRDMYSQLYSQEIAMTVTTGYGRGLLEQADRKITEITCHGAGAAYLMPQCSAVIDIGGQDCKVMLLDEHGKVTDFLMNDKCSAGTGKFLEVMANRLGVTLQELFELAAEGEVLPISSLCTVFAESEVINYIGEGKKREDIAAGVVDSVAAKVAQLSQRKTLSDKVILTGGLSDSVYFTDILSKKLGCVVETTKNGRYAGALGAALLAKEKKKR